MKPNTLYWRGPEWYCSTVTGLGIFTYKVGDQDLSEAKQTAERFGLETEVVWFDEKILIGRADSIIKL